MMHIGLFSVTFLLLVASWRTQISVFAFTTSRTFTTSRKITSSTLMQQSWIVRGGKSSNDVESSSSLLTTTETSKSNNDDAKEEQRQRRLDKLNQSLISFNNTAAADLLHEIQDLRTQQQPTNGSNSMTPVEVLLDELLMLGPDSKKNILDQLLVKFILRTKFSQRARMASLRRTLDLTTPPPTQQEQQSDSNDTDEQRQRRRRRALLSLLRTLAQSETDSGFTKSNNIPAIRQIEKRAYQEKKGKSNNIDAMIQQRRPAELETPNYTVLFRSSKKISNFEIRQYESYSVCSVSMNNNRKPNPNTDAQLSENPNNNNNVQAFGALAGYLFGKNQQETKMKMTTPVLTTYNTQEQQEQMSFVMPSMYWNKNENNEGEEKVSSSIFAPKPLPGSGVIVQEVPAEQRAVLVFGGYAIGNAKKWKQELLNQINQQQKIYEIVPDATVVLAQYNDPFTPPWKRLNEVSIAVRQR